LTIVLCAVVS